MADKFVVLCGEKVGSAEPRARALVDHMKHLESAKDQIFLAAALKNEAGLPSGSIMIVSATDANDARRIVERDPFFSAGVWESLHVHRLGAAVGHWVCNDAPRVSGEP